MPSASELLTRNANLLRSRVNRHGLYGLAVSLVIVVSATAVVSLQITGRISLEGMLLAQRENFALRVLDLLPIVFTIWGQYMGTLMAYHAGAIILEQTDDLRAETTAWKVKSAHEAAHDSLTGLVNRVRFYDVLQQAIHVAGQEERSLAVLFIDLDGFKEVNDAFGPQCGDQILKHAAERLQRLVPGTDTVARMGGDEFALLIGEGPAADVAVTVAQRVHKALESPFQLNRSRVEVSASVGFALFPAHGSDADSLVQRAEAAMAAAKRTQEGYASYNAGLTLDNPRRLMLMTELRRAVEAGELELYYQPKAGIKSGIVTSAEALVRWTHPEHGRISPQEFIPLAERTRLIRPLSDWVLRTAVRQLAEWRDAGIDIGLSVNISARDLANEELVVMLKTLFGSHGGEPGRLTLEITESSVMSDAARSLDMLKKLNAMQLRLSIDDFGTGYSSLAYLSRLPVQEMKIDKTFVCGMTASRNDRLIVNAAVDLGHSLGLEVVAEGVEDRDTLELLRAEGCDMAQGFLISQPLPAARFLQWLDRNRKLW
jgi:diguanylate cyclase (GGDEF)-like protein